MSVSRSVKLPENYKSKALTLRDEKAKVILDLVEKTKSLETYKAVARDMSLMLSIFESLIERIAARHEYELILLPLPTSDGSEIGNYRRMRTVLYNSLKVMEVLSADLKALSEAGDDKLDGLSEMIEEFRKECTIKVDARSLDEHMDVAAGSKTEEEVETAHGGQSRTVSQVLTQRPKRPASRAGASSNTGAGPAENWG